MKKVEPLLVYSGHCLVTATPCVSLFCPALLTAAKPFGISANFTPSDGEQYPDTMATLAGDLQ